MKDFFGSDFYKRLVISVIALIIILISFGVGVLVGYRKAQFSSVWAENYERNFGMMHRGPLGLPSPDEFMNTHGTIGVISNIASSTITIKSRDGTEKNILFSSSTVVSQSGVTIPLSNLKINDPIMVIGSPNNQGQIEAQIIRIMPVVPIMLNQQNQNNELN